MKKAFITLFLIILLSSSAGAFAANENANHRGIENSQIGQQKAGENKEKAGKPDNLPESNNNGGENKENGNGNSNVNENGDVDIDGLCDPEDEWINHGQYVSCVAKQHQGGSTVSVAARSDIGKKQNNISPTPSLNPSVSPTPSVEPSVTPSIEPSITPIGTPTATPTPETEVVPLNEQIQGIIDQIQDLIDQLKSLVP